jgi:DNA-binding LacI/PurR family transcriptional regulator
MRQRRGATLKDVAEQVGVSRMTVSAVLSGGSGNIRVSQATRERVLDAARKLRYRPNALARSLRSRTTNVIGVYSGYHYFEPRNSFFAQLLGGLQEGCVEYRKDLLLHSVFRGDTAEDIHTALMDGRIDGLIMFAPAHDPLVEPLATSHLPVVAVADPVSALTSVTVDDAGSARPVLEYLAARGHRRLVYRSVDRVLISVERRHAAFREEAGRMGLTMEEWCATDRVTDDSWFEGWLARPTHERPTAVVCWNDVAAYDVLDRCAHIGIRVPEALAVTGFDDIPNPVASRFRLTTVRAPWAEVGRTAVRLLVEQIDGAEVPGETVLPVELVLGDTA